MAVRVLTRVANCQGVSERAPWDEARLALTKPSKHGGRPDLVFFSEIAWLDLAALARELGDWHVIQLGERGSAEAGVGLAARVPLEPLPLIVGSRATREGAGGVRMRPLVGGVGWGTELRAVHAPPPDSPNAREDYMAQARRCEGVLGGDWNRDPEWMRRTSVRAYRGQGACGVLAPHDLRPGRAKTVDIDSDHLAVDVPLWIPARRVRRA